MYTALYRAYRPEIFDEIMGQEHIVRILKNQIETDSTSHAYLFCGTRGTGKTTTARILAKGLNCTSDESRPCGTCSACRSIKEGTYLDVVEIDAASNNGVDNIRELRESVKYPPAAGRKKVYIIDEVHMLSTGAFNALLKTLEEPPEYVVFILATTEPQKLPATILSRCMRLDFRRVPEQVLIEGMQEICAKRGITVSEDALRIITANADGSVRDGLSILDQCISGGETEVGSRDVLDFLGASGEEIFTELTELVRKSKAGDALVLVANALADGKDVRQFMRDWINHYRNLLMVKFIRNPQEVINLSVENIDRIRRQSEVTDLEDINRGILELSRTMQEAKWSTQPRILLELVIVKLSSPSFSSMQPQDSIFAGRMPVQGKQPQVSAAASVESVTEEKRPEPERDAETAAYGVDGPVSPAEDAGDHDTGFDCNSVWNAVFQEGEHAKGSFYIISSKSRLTGIQEHTFTVEVATEYMKKIVENSRELIEQLMEKYTGAKRTMNIVVNGENNNGGTEGMSVEDIASEAGKALGIDIEIQ